MRISRCWRGCFGKYESGIGYPFGMNKIAVSGDHFRRRDAENGGRQNRKNLKMEVMKKG